MGADDREHLLGATVVAVEELLGSLQQSFQGFKELTMRHLAPEVPPQHFDGIEPWAVGRQVQ